VRWVPNSPNLFIVSHLDGTVIVYDKEREDGIFVPQDPETNGNQWDPRYNIFVTMPPWHHASGYVPPASGKPDKEKAIKNPVSHWRVSRKAIVGKLASGYSLRMLPNNLDPLQDFVFSPDVKYVAAISEDGCLRVIDALAEQ
jgi:catabolite repression protein CreC